MARFRLLVPAHIDGVVLAAGSIIHKAEDWVGPHRTAVPHVDTLAEGTAAVGRDEPLYERLPDEPTAETAPEVDQEAEEKAKALAEAEAAYGVTTGL